MTISQRVRIRSFCYTRLYHARRWARQYRHIWRWIMDKEAIPWGIVIGGGLFVGAYVIAAIMRGWR